jgi:hypothetical protein
MVDAPGVSGAPLGGGVKVSIVISGVGGNVAAEVAGVAVIATAVGVTIGGMLTGGGVVTPIDGAAEPPVGTTD